MKNPIESVKLKVSFKNDATLTEGCSDPHLQLDKSPRERQHTHTLTTLPHVQQLEHTTGVSRVSSPSQQFEDPSSCFSASYCKRGKWALDL